MKKNLKTIIVLFLAAFSMLSACTRETVTVYDVTPLNGGKTITVINDSLSVQLTMVKGDTVAVNLSDSVIEGCRREDRAKYPCN